MWRTRAGVGVALLVCACAEDEGQRHALPGLTVIEGFDDPSCADTFPYFERRLAWLERETGLPRDPRGLAYHWYLEESEVEAVCGFPLGGCALGRTLYGNIAVFSHELVHAHLSRLGYPRAWLVEGMAVMLEDDRYGAPHPVFTPSRLMQKEDAFGFEYAAAGAFTAYLRDRYGMALLLEYYEASADMDVADAVTSFAEVFGDDFADVEADYLAAGLPAAPGSLDCEAAEVAWSGGAWEHMFKLACEESGSVGPESVRDDTVPDRYLWSKVTMTAPAGWVSLDLEATDRAWIQLLSCDGAEAAYVGDGYPHADAELAGGRYLVLATGLVEEAPTARVTVRPLDRAPASATSIATRGPDAPHLARTYACAGAADAKHPRNELSSVP